MSLHIDARLVTRFCAGKYHILAIRKKASVTPVDGIVSHLLRLSGAKRNQKKLTRNMQDQDERTQFMSGEKS